MFLQVLTAYQALPVADQIGIAVLILYVYQEIKTKWRGTVALAVDTANQTKRLHAAIGALVAAALSVKTGGDSGAALVGLLATFGGTSILGATLSKIIPEFGTAPPPPAASTSPNLTAAMPPVVADTPAA